MIERLGEPYNLGVGLRVARFQYKDRQLYFGVSGLAMVTAWPHKRNSSAEAFFADAEIDELAKLVLSHLEATGKLEDALSSHGEHLLVTGVEEWFRQAISGRE